MKKIMISLVIILLIISGCSQAKQEEKAQVNEVKAVETETNDTETNEVEKEETPPKEEMTFQHSDYKYLEKTS